MLGDFIKAKTCACYGGRNNDVTGYSSDSRAKIKCFGYSEHKI